MNSNWAETLKNFHLTEEISQKLDKYYQLIIEYNKKMNLTRITEEKEVYYKHFYDSLLITDEIKLTDQNLCDVGSGLGVPGIVLKICFPQLQLTIIESNKKKCDFMEIVVQELGLENVYIVNNRVEQFAHEYREIFDVVVARALAPLNILNEICLALVKIDGLFVAYKGLNSGEELAAATNSLKIMGAQLINQINCQLPHHYGQRSLLVIKKNKLTALKYPRIYQQIKKQPL